MAKVTVDGVPLSYEEHGSGAPLVLIHGSVSDSRIWREHAAALADRYRVIVPTQRYFGDAPWADDGAHFSIDQHGGDLVAFMDALGLAGVRLVGWSYGAAVALWAAVLRPSLLEALVLHEPALASHIVDEEARRRAAEDRVQMMARSKALVEAGDGRGAVEAFVDDVNGAPGTFARMPGHVRAANYASSRTLPLLFRAPPPPVTEESVRNLKIRTTVALGVNTRPFFRIAAFAVAGRPNVKLVQIDGARHLWPLECVDEFVKLVSETVARA